MSRKMKKILTYVVVTLITIAVANGLIDVFVAKTFTDDLFGLRDLVVATMDIVKLFIDFGVAYYAYVIYKMFN